MPRLRMDHQHLAGVLTGVSFPARTWRLVAQADYYGADCHTRAALDRLPPGIYDSLDVVVSMINRPVAVDSYAHAGHGHAGHGVGRR